MGVGIDWVNVWVVAGFPKRAVRAVRLSLLARSLIEMELTHPIECIEECVEQISACDLDWLVYLVVNLIQCHRLWIDQSIA